MHCFMVAVVSQIAPELDCGAAIAAQQMPNDDFAPRCSHFIIEGAGYAIGIRSKNRFTAGSVITVQISGCR